MNSNKKVIISVSSSGISALTVLEVLGRMTMIGEIAGEGRQSM
jgi:hypothetical protein